MIKGQTEMFEYVIAAFFIVLIIIFVMFMLGSYQMSQLELEKQKFSEQKAEQLLKRVVSSPLVAKEDGVLDDSKLIAALGLCDDMEQFFGKNWYAVIIILDSSGKTVRCQQGEYSTDCNYWVICADNLEARISKEKASGAGEEYAYTVPVNVARKMGWVTRRGTATRAEPALIEVWTYD